MPGPLAAPVRARLRGEAVDDAPARFASLDAFTGSLRELTQAALPPHMVPAMFVLLEALPLTSNGKLDRRALPAPDANRLENEPSIVAPSNPAEETLVRIWTEVLRHGRVGVHDDFFALGGDSILGIQVVARARQAGLQITTRQLFDRPTIAALASVSSTVVPESEPPPEGDAPLGPIQRAFFARHPHGPDRYNQAVLLAPRELFTADTIARALDAVAAHHDAMRLRFTPGADGWTQRYVPQRAHWPLTRVDLADVRPEDRARALADAADTLQASLSIQHGPVARAAFVTPFDARPRLLLVAHHLVVDGVSWRILVEDLATALDQLAAGRAIALPPRTASYQQWTRERVDAMPREKALPVARVPRDTPDGTNRVEAVQTVRVTLSRDETAALLQRVPEAYHTQIEDVLLTAVAKAVADWTHERTVDLDVEGHGRDPGTLDLTRTVGWFTSIRPVRLVLPAHDAPGAWLCAVKEQLRAASRTHDATTVDPRADIAFNYLGRIDAGIDPEGPLGLAPESPGALRDPSLTRWHAIEIEGRIADARLTLEVGYAATLHARETIESLADGLLSSLRRWIEHCLAPASGAFTPSDVPDIALDQTTLDALVGNGRNVVAIGPLAPTQQGMLFEVLQSPGAGLYLEQLRCELVGPLDVAAFVAAWQSAFARHEVFRTSFHWDGLPQPVCVVHREARVHVTRLDVRGDDALARLDAVADEARHAGFVLEKAPLARLALVRTADDVHAMVFTFHHLLLDGWSLARVLREVSLGDGGALRAPRPYLDYVRWLSQRPRAEAEVFWRRALAGFVAPTRLGLERRSTSGTRALATAAQALTAAETRAAEAFARTHRVTVGLLVQAAWSLLLARYSREEDVAFGITVAGRPAEFDGVEEMVGLFINTVPLRVQIPRGRTVAVWLDHLRTWTTEVRAFELTPLPGIQSWSELSRGRALFDTLVVFENYPLDAALHHRIAGTTVRDVRITEETGYALTLMALPTATLQFKLGYDTARFEPGAVERLLGHFVALFRSLIDSPGRTLESLRMVGPAELDTLHAWSLSAPRASVAPSLHARFAAAAARSPDAVALVHGTQRVSYARLLHDARVLASRLRSIGVGRGSHVGVYMDRSPDLVVALLGVLFAGGAYVPLDPAYPATRVAFMARDARIVAVLSDATHLEAAQRFDVPVLQPDASGVLGAGALPEIGPLDAAFVVYTSGSTGTPKGVVVTHGGMSRLLGPTQFVTVKPDDVVAQVATVAFDVGNYELLLPLVHGATLAIIPSATLLAPTAFAAELARARVSVLHLTVQLFHQMVREAPASLAGVHTLLFGGEAPEARWVREARSALPTTRLVQMYGPTETSTFATCHVVDTVAPDATAVPIGNPVVGTTVYLLDGTFAPVPVGVAGEVFVGDVAVARGYLDRPGLTAERFVPDPFSREPGGRMYRTGDLGRLRADGLLEFLGRTDHQVKIRGYRVEPAEVESQLARHPDLEAAVVAVHATPEGPRLVAYVVGRPAPPVDALRRFMAERVPGYMIPAQFMALESLPLTPNGKLDRRALPAPGTARPDVAATFVAPGTPSEIALAAIWCDVLRLDRVGIHDSFFELGGDSILSIQIVSRARRAGLALRPGDLFAHPTVAALAATGTASSLVPFSPMQRAVLASAETDAVVWTVPTPGLDRDTLAARLASLVASHDALRLRIVRSSDGASQHVVPAAAAVVPIVQRGLRGLAPEAVARALAASADELTRGLDASPGPVLRVAWCETDLGPVTQFVGHRAVFDAPSCRLITRAMLDGSILPVDPSREPVFTRWTEAVARLADRAVSSDERIYWRETARRARAIASSRVADARTDVVATLHTRTVRFESDAVTWRDATRTQREDLLLTALGRALVAWTQQPAVHLALQFDGRGESLDALDATGTIGPMALRMPLLLTPDDVRAVHAQRRAVPRYGLGLSALQHEDADAFAMPDPGVRVCERGLDQGAREVTADPSCIVVAHADVDGVFELEFTASDRGASRSSIARMAEATVASLHELVAVTVEAVPDTELVQLEGDDVARILAAVQFDDD